MLEKSDLEKSILEVKGHLSELEGHVSILEDWVLKKRRR
jgi:hypothetical protein